jgi:type IV pilus assembly protein PilA
MIVVAIIGVLAAVAIPAFTNYVKRAKTSEVGGNLKAMFTGAAAYYQAEHWDRGLAQAGHSTACIVVGDFQTPNAPGVGKQRIDWTQVTGNERAAFQAVNFSIADPIYFKYWVRGGGQTCGNQPNAQLYSFQANGDLDGVGATSLFEIQAGASQTNELFRSPGIYIENELD